MGSKSKVVAVLLAVFISPATWLYTYREDGAKFWLWLGLFVATVVLGAVSPGLSYVGGLAGLGVWIWAIATSVSRSGEWYETYGSGAGSGYGTV